MRQSGNAFDSTNRKNARADLGVELWSLGSSPTNSTRINRVLGENRTRGCHRRLRLKAIRELDKAEPAHGRIVIMECGWGAPNGDASAIKVNGVLDVAV